MFWRGVITKGRVSDEPINGVDFMPTFAEISGVDIEKDKFDGESILPLILGKDYKRQKPMFFHFPLYLGVKDYQHTGKRKLLESCTFNCYNEK